MQICAVWMDDQQVAVFLPSFKAHEGVLLKQETRTIEVTRGIVRQLILSKPQSQLTAIPWAFNTAQEAQRGRIWFNSMSEYAVSMQSLC